MNDYPALSTEFASPPFLYEIRVKGHLGREWADWFEGLEFKPCENGEMLLSGRIVDQAALIGVLTRLNRLNLALLSVRSSGE